MIFEFTKSNGEIAVKYNPSYVYINYQLSTPADSLTAVFNSGEFDDYKYVQVIYDEKIIFTGVVDLVKTVINKNGISQRVECRSMAGCLLDNQLMPQNIQNITDTVIYQHYLKPYNISVNKLTNKPLKEVLNITKGQSVYTLLSRYSSKVHNAQPRINQYGIAVLDGNINSNSFVFTNGFNSFDDNCYSCTEITVQHKRCGVISKVFVRNTLNETGYGLTVENKKAESRGISAVRYLDATPSSGNCIYDANRIINNSNKELLTITVKCPCIVFNPLGGSAKVIADEQYYENLEINNISYIYSTSGVFTTITMNEREI